MKYKLLKWAMEKNMIHSYRKYEMSYQEYANMLRKYILDRVDLKVGMLQPFHIPENQKYNIPLIDIRWKGDIHLIYYYLNPWYTYYCVERNGERVSQTWHVSVTNENTIKNFQKIINEVNDHKYDHKKSYSDKVREIVANRGLTSYMNKTKWLELSKILLEEFDVEIDIMYKTLFENRGPACFWCINSDENWHPPLFKSIEWFKIDTIYREYNHRGYLLDDEIISYDLTEKILELLDQNHIPYEETEEPNVYIIYGYK